MIDDKLVYMAQQYNLNVCASAYWHAKDHSLWKDMAIVATTIKELIEHFYVDGADYRIVDVETPIGDVQLKWPRMEVL